MQDKLREVCACFRIEGNLEQWEELKVGNINKTFKVTYARENGLKKTYIVQKVNTFVFKNPEEVMENIDRVTRHLRMEDPGSVALHYHHTRDGKNFIRDGEAIWRLFNFVPSISYSNSRDEEVVRNAGYAFGAFQEKMSRFDASLLHETIPDFHNTQKRFEAMEKAVTENKAGRLGEVQEEVAYLRSVKAQACTLCRMQQEGALPLRVTHNDTKVNNVLFDPRDKKALVVIDLDTVMPGLAGNDFGDAIRSITNTAAEDEKDLSLVSCDLNLFRAFAEGFLAPTAKGFTQAETDTFALSSFALTVELALRFLTDYLQGDPYFYCAYEGHNLVRTRNQIALAKDMWNKMEDMNDIIHECAAKYQ